MMETFQKPLSSHYESSGQPLYNAEDMRKFSEIDAPGLFDVLPSSILRDDTRLSEDRKTLREQRTVARLHITTYFRYLARNEKKQCWPLMRSCGQKRNCCSSLSRSQKSCPLQKDLGLYMHQHGLSRACLNNCPMFGFSVAPRSIDRHNINEQYPSVLKQKIEQSVKVKLNM